MNPGSIRPVINAMAGYFIAFSVIIIPLLLIIL